MGTDVHILAQHRLIPTDDAVWHDFESAWNNNRNYLLFTAICGVRARGEFLLRSNNKAVEPIAKGRGIPDDIRKSEHFENGWGDTEYFGVCLGEHSFTWFTAEEVMAWFNQNVDIIASGIITLEQFQKWNGGEPDSYLTMHWGPNSRVHELSPMACRQYLENREEFLKDLIEDIPGLTHVSVIWRRDAREILSKFYNAIKTDMSVHGRHIRYTIGFDS